MSYSPQFDTYSHHSGSSHGGDSDNESDDDVLRFSENPMLARAALAAQRVQMVPLAARVPMPPRVTGRVIPPPPRTPPIPGPPPMPPAAAGSKKPPQLHGGSPGGLTVVTARSPRRRARGSKHHRHRKSKESPRFADPNADSDGSGSGSGSTSATEPALSPASRSNPHLMAALGGAFAHSEPGSLPTPSHGVWRTNRLQAALAERAKGQAPGAANGGEDH